MSSSARLALYSSIIVLGALGGALLPLYSKTRGRQVAFLAFAAGVMLGAAFFHMLPEAVEVGGYGALAVVPLGFLLLFILERYVFVHVCEEPPECHDHSHNPAMGLTAFLGLSVHTLFDGVALGSAVTEGVGLMALLAIVAHKIPSSMSLAAILVSEGRSRRGTLAFVGLFGAMVPVGAVLYTLLQGSVDRIASRALAFSAGTFLYIAVSDLLPYVNRHGKSGRLGSVIGLLLGLLAMFGLSFLTGHGHAGA
jgi:zinc and cadmium transporter